MNNKPSKIGHLHITSFRGISLGAIHWYGKLIIGLHSEKEKIELNRPLTAKEAKTMNSEASRVGFFNKHKPGDLIDGFMSEEDAIRKGIEYFKKHYNGILYLGDTCSCSAWKRVILWPVDNNKINNLVIKMNKISDKFISLNGYEGPEEEVVTKLDNEWYKLYNELNDICQPS